MVNFSCKSVGLAVILSPMLIFISNDYAIMVHVFVLYALYEDLFHHPLILQVGSGEI